MIVVYGFNGQVAARLEREYGGLVRVLDHDRLIPGNLKADHILVAVRYTSHKVCEQFNHLYGRGSWTPVNGCVSQMRRAIAKLLVPVAA